MSNYFFIIRLFSLKPAINNFCNDQYALAEQLIGAGQIFSLP